MTFIVGEIISSEYLRDGSQGNAIEVGCRYTYAGLSALQNIKLSLDHTPET